MTLAEQLNWTIGAPMVTISLDFDGVLHQYAGIEHEPNFPVPEGDPVQGALETVGWLQQKGYDLVISSSRANDPGGQEAIEQWLAKWGFPAIPVSLQKPIAKLYVDDRGFRFTGPDSFAELIGFLTENPLPGRWGSTENA